MGNVQENPPARNLQDDQMNVQERRDSRNLGAPPPPPLIQISPEVLRQLVEDVSTQAANRVSLSML
ncbi:UNVERIFIED_CONTAM: hypothetical protein Sradi_4920600 [Sesamum radiatum]|uniref:Uncharacterized protein n=1 Tax=Sesamum radiatum TaxID=300843 RepID=A0AAW2MCV9_SESRA